MAEEKVLEGMEIVALRVELDLVPDWSNVLEQIARRHGRRVAVGVEASSFVVKVALPPDRRPAFLADVERHWKAFVEGRKRDGRWNR